MMNRGSVLSALSFAVGSVLVFPGLVMAEMQRLDDSDLADIRGQSGITLEMDVGMTADRVSYFDDGNGIHLEDFRIGSATDPDGQAFHRVRVDITDDAALNLDYLVEDRRIEFGDVRLVGAPGLSMGGVFFDHALEGYLRIRPGGALGGPGYAFDSAYTMTGGRLGYRTNGNEIFLDDMTLEVEALGVTLDVVGEALHLEAPRIVGSYDVGAIRYSGNPLNHGNSMDVTTGAVLPSYGSISGAFDLTTATDIKAGGRSGEGLRIDHEATINSAHFIYRDGGNALGLRDITGSYRVSDLRLDVTDDWQGRAALGLALGSMDGEINIGAIEMGDSGRSLGEVNIRFLLEDREFEGRHYANALYLQGGRASRCGRAGAPVGDRMEPETGGPELYRER